MGVDPEEGGTEASMNTYEIDALERALPMAGAKSPALLCVTMAIVSPGAACTSSATRREIRGAEAGSRTATSTRFGTSTTWPRWRSRALTGCHVDGPNARL